MPQITIKAGIADAEGREEELSGYLCDWPDCPNVATEVIGVVRELRTCTAVCAEHAAQLASRADSDSACS